MAIVSIKPFLVLIQILERLPKLIVVQKSSSKRKRTWYHTCSCYNMNPYTIHLIKVLHWLEQSLKFLLPCFLQNLTYPFFFVLRKLSVTSRMIMIKFMTTEALYLRFVKLLIPFSTSVSSTSVLRIINIGFEILATISIIVVSPSSNSILTHSFKIWEMNKGRGL